jgi:hypothetical protein
MRPQQLSLRREGIAVAIEAAAGLRLGPSSEIFLQGSFQ